MATCTSLEPNDLVMSSRAGIKKVEKEPVGCAVKVEKNPSDTSANKEIQVKRFFLCLMKEKLE